MAKIQPGLERIAALLKHVTFPWKSIHVAGTNGKGSVCHYASSMLVGRNVKVGKFTSPHLVDRWDCISINGRPVEESTFRKVENHFSQANRKHEIGASPFEILTATAFTIFNDANVEVGVVEVGMGGKLDSTNILNNQAVSVISKIARDHEAFLGNTLSEIAAHKAGILRPHVPYIINPANEANVQTVIQDYAQEIQAGPRLLTTSFDLGSRLYDTSKWLRATSTLVPFQLENLKLAVVAVMHTLQNMNQATKPVELAKTLLLNAKRHSPGRQEMIRAIPVFRNATDRKNHVLVDGAHNPDAAAALDSFVRENMRFGQSPAKERPTTGWPVTWVLAMTEGKDARKYLSTLLKPGDNVVTTTFGPVDGMPWVKPMDPKELLDLAKSVEPHITGVHVPVIGALRALCTAKYMSNQMAPWSPIVLTGSLYLVGDLHRELRPRAEKNWWTDEDPATAADRESLLKIQAEERQRADSILSSRKERTVNNPEDSEIDEQRRLQEELDALNREVEGLEIEEKRVAREHSVILDTPMDEQSLGAAERLEREDRRFAELYSTPEQIAAQIARAEKAKAALARHQEKLEAAAKARAEKSENRQKLLDRRAERKARKIEQKRFEKEQQKLQEADVGHGYVPKNDIREQVRRKVLFREQGNHPFRVSRPSASSSVGDRAVSSLSTPDADYQDALSNLKDSKQALGEAEPKGTEVAERKAAKGPVIEEKAAERETTTSSPVPVEERSEANRSEDEPREMVQKLKVRKAHPGTKHR